MAVATPTPEPARRAAAVTQTLLLTRRLLSETTANAEVFVPNILMSVFFLLVFNGSLGDLGPIQRVVGGSYLNFILPVAALAASITGCLSGLRLVSDLETGYFRRLLAMPIARGAIIGSSMLLGAIQILVQTTVIIGVATLLGARCHTGVPGLLVVLILAFVWGMGVAAFSIAIGLRTSNAQVTYAMALLLLALTFVAPVFVPADRVQPWLKAVSSINPATYVLDAMRALMIDGWEWSRVARGFAFAAAWAAVTMAWALVEARRRSSAR